MAVPHQESDEPQARRTMEASEGRQRLGAALPYCIVFGGFLLVLVYALHRSCGINDGNLVYTLDDPYIHMALAKNLVLHGVFGVTRYGFASASSSPLWTLLIAATYKLIGIKEWVPFAWAVLFGLASVILTLRICKTNRLTTGWSLVVCAAVLYFTPIIPVIFTGMEHCMHLFFVLLFLDILIRSLSNDERRFLVPLGTTAAACAAIRYESLFIAPAVAALLLARGRWRSMTVMGLAFSMPVLIYGIVSVSNGSFFLPNSLMLKGDFSHFDSIFSAMSTVGLTGLKRLFETPHLLSLTILVLFGISLSHRQIVNQSWVALCLCAALMIHLALASIGWFFRYEAYLVGAGVAMTGIRLGQRFSRSCNAISKGRIHVGHLSVALCIALLCWPLHQRVHGALRCINLAAHHVYRQQMQLGRFFQTHYPAGTSVAVNDLGAITYLADVRCLDVSGLGSVDVLRYRRSRSFGPTEFSGLLEDHSTEVVVVYRSCLAGRMPDHLRPVCDWWLPNPYHEGRVTFFATTTEYANNLRKALISYQPSLPESVVVDYYK